MYFCVCVFYDSRAPETKHIFYDGEVESVDGVNMIGRLIEVGTAVPESTLKRAKQGVRPEFFLLNTFTTVSIVWGLLNQFLDPSLGLRKVPKRHS